jgi:threonine synthase
MDVGNPSNMERLMALYPAVGQMRAQLCADSVDDAAIRARIVQDHAEFGRIWCPHTAVAAEVYRRLPAEDRRAAPWVLVATAHPAKFPEVVEPLIGAPVEIPDSLAQLLERPQRFSDLPPNLPAVAAALA